MSDAQIVLAFVFGDQPTTLDDKKTALALAKECGPEVGRIANNHVGISYWQTSPQIRTISHP